MPESTNTTSSSTRSFLQDIEHRFVGVTNDYERTMLRHGAAWFFLVLCGYYILRPIREQISASYGTDLLSRLFWTTFISMLVAIPLYSVLVGRFHRRVLVPSIYGFFIISLGGFWAALQFGPPEYKVWISCVLFVWISVYGLFVVSFFWSVVGDMLSTEQGRRIFGVMSGFGTAGGLVGSTVAKRTVGSLGVANLMLIPLGLLVLGLFVYFSLEYSYVRLTDGKEVRRSSGKATGGNPFAGIYAVLRSRYLLWIACFGFFLATCGTTIYFQQAEIVKTAFGAPNYETLTDSLDEPTAAKVKDVLATDETNFESGLAEIKAAVSGSLNDLDLETEMRRLRDEQAAIDAKKTAYFADVNFYVNIVTLVFQFFVVGFLMRNIGLGWTLALLPIAYVFGITSLALMPSISVLAVITVTGRAAEYGISNPAREVLYTSVNREDRYKAKSFIDTVVRRSGDSIVGSVYGLLRGSAGFAMTTMSWLVIPVALAWIVLSLFIGKENARIVAKLEAEESAT